MIIEPINIEWDLVRSPVEALEIKHEMKNAVTAVKSQFTSTHLISTPKTSREPKPVRAMNINQRYPINPSLGIISECVKKNDTRHLKMSGYLCFFFLAVSVDEGPRKGWSGRLSFVFVFLFVFFFSRVNGARRKFSPGDWFRLPSYRVFLFF